MDFTPSQYACPIGLRRGGGNGDSGLCVMELASVMMKYDPAIHLSTPTGLDGVVGEAVSSFYASDAAPSIHHAIRYAFIALNDFNDLTQNDKQTYTLAERADILWPLLPYSFGSGAAAEGGRGDDGPYKPGGDISKELLRVGVMVEEEWGGYYIHAEDGTTKSVHWAPINGLDAHLDRLKKVIEAVWVVLGREPDQTDYTPEQIARLENYIAHHGRPGLLSRDEAVYSEAAA